MAGTNRGIDYGLGKTNIDENGIRFGVIPHSSVGDFWYEDSEAVYPEADEYASEEDLEFADPIGYKFEDSEYLLHQEADDPDIWVQKSPYYTYAQFCSPCAPGAIYLLNELDTTDGPMEENKGYCLGPEWFENGVAPYTIYRVADGTIVPPPIQTKEELLKALQKWADEHPEEIYWDYRDQLSKDQIEKLFEDPEYGEEVIRDETFELNFEYIYELESQLMEQMKEEFAADFRRAFPDEDELEQFLDEEVRMLLSVDCNIRELIKNTPDVVVILTIYSDYDCAISTDKIDVEPGDENYLSDVWQRVQKSIDIKAYEAEFINAYTASLLCFAVKMPILEAAHLVKDAKKATHVKIPKGTQFGFFSTWNGSGSMWESQNSKDLILEQNKIGGWGVAPDTRKYTMAEVYGGTEFIDSGQFIVWNQKELEDKKMKKAHRIYQALAKYAEEKLQQELLWGVLADDPEKFVVIGNWNDLPDTWQPLFERLGSEVWFEDEYAICTDCNGLLYTQPGFYGDEMRFITTEDSIICQDCIEKHCDSAENLEDAFADFIYNYHSGVSVQARAIPSWMTERFVGFGWNCWSEGDDSYCQKYETGFHPGQNDSPEKIAKDIWKFDPGLGIVFAIRSIGQFDVHWQVLVKPLADNYDDDRLPKTLLMEAKNIFARGGAPDDFCVQHTNWPESVVFGGVNRVIWRQDSGFYPDKEACTSTFLRKLEGSKNGKK
jgi:hypothetical protein